MTTAKKTKNAIAAMIRIRCAVMSFMTAPA
jgi:hypothetical protein